MCYFRSIKCLLRETRHPRNIYDSLRFLFIFGFLFGLLPFNVCCSSEDTSQLRATKIGYLNVGLRVFFYAFCFVYSMLKDQALLAYLFTSSLSSFTDSFQKFNGMLSVITVLVICLKRRRYFIKLVQEFDVIERNFLSVGVAVMYRVSAKTINFNIVLMMSSTLGFIVLSLFLILIRNAIHPSFTASITFYSLHIIACGVVVFYTTATYKIREYLRALNKVLKNLSHQWDNRSVKATFPSKQRSLQCLDSFSMYTIVTKNPSEIIQESMEIHHLICEAASTANKYFTYQLLTIISIAFLIIVFDAYYVLETLLGKSKRESKFKTIEFVTFFSCQMILYLIAIISIVEGSNRAIKKSEKTGSIVHSLLNKAKNADVKEKLQQFSLQLMHMKINFTAAGLFNIDRTLYFTISGALTTYLIILLQFTSSSPEHNKSNCCNLSNDTRVDAN